MSPADSIIALYRRHAQAWTRARGTHLPERTWIERFRSELPEGAQVLDLGCGSGQPIATYLAQRGCRITGIDSAPEMIAQFTANLPGQRAQVADMRRLDLGYHFEGVLAWDSFFHLEHDAQRAMFAIFAAHAGPGAPLMFTSGPAHGEAIGALEGEPLYHASLAPEEYSALLAEHGFTVLAHTPQDPTCGGRTVWLARRELEDVR